MAGNSLFLGVIIYGVCLLFGISISFLFAGINVACLVGYFFLRRKQRILR